MTEANSAAKSPEELRAELAAKRAELGDTVEELAHRVDVPAQVRAKKDDTLAKLQDAKVEASRRVHEGTEKVKAVYAEKAPPAVQQKVDQAVEKGKAVYTEKAPVVQQHVNKAVADARPVAQGHALLAEKAPPVERTLREKPGLVAGVAVALVVLLIVTSRKRKHA